MDVDLKKLAADINVVRVDMNRDLADKVTAVGHAVATDVVGAVSCEEALHDPDLELKLDKFRELGCVLSVAAMVDAIEFAVGYLSLRHDLTRRLTFDQVRWICRIPRADARLAAAESIVANDVSIDEITAVTEGFAVHGITPDRLAVARQVLEVARGTTAEERLIERLPEGGRVA